MPPIPVIDNIQYYENFSIEQRLRVVVIIDDNPFSYSCIIAFRKLYEEKKNPQQVLQEISWLKSVEQSEKYVNLQSIKKIGDLLHNNPASRCVNIGECNIRTDDLSTIIGERWLDEAVINIISKIINRHSNPMGLKSYICFANSVMDASECSTNIKEFFCTDLGHSQIIFYVFIGKDEDGEVKYVRTIEWEVRLSLSFFISCI